MATPSSSNVKLNGKNDNGLIEIGDEIMRGAALSRGSYDASKGKEEIQKLYKAPYDYETNQASKFTPFRSSVLSQPSFHSPLPSSSTAIASTSRINSFPRSSTLESSTEATWSRGAAKLIYPTPTPEREAPTSHGYSNQVESFDSPTMLSNRSRTKNRNYFEETSLPFIDMSLPAETGADRFEFKLPAEPGRRLEVEYEEEEEEDYGFEEDLVCLPIIATLPNPASLPKLPDLSCLPSLPDLSLPLPNLPKKIIPFEIDLSLSDDEPFSATEEELPREVKKVVRKAPRSTAASRAARQGLAKNACIACKAGKTRCDRNLKGCSSCKMRSEKFKRNLSCRYSNENSQNLTFGQRQTAKAREAMHLNREMKRLSAPTATLDSGFTKTGLETQRALENALEKLECGPTLNFIDSDGEESRYAFRSAKKIINYTDSTLNEDELLEEIESLGSQEDLGEELVPSDEIRGENFDYGGIDMNFETVEPTMIEFSLDYDPTLDYIPLFCYPVLYPRPSSSILLENPFLEFQRQRELALMDQFTVAGGDIDGLPITQVVIDDSERERRIQVEFKLMERRGMGQGVDLGAGSGRRGSI